MGILSDFFISDGPGVPAYSSGASFPAEDRCQGKRITPLEAGRLLAVLRGGGDASELMNEFVLLTPEQDEQWTFCVPQDFLWMSL